MRKRSEPWRVGLLCGLVFAFGLCPFRIAAQAGEAKAGDQSAPPKVGVALFVELRGPEWQKLHGSEASSLDLLWEAAASGKQGGPLSISLASALRAILDPLPSSFQGSYILASKDADRSLYNLDKEELASCGNLVAGFYSLQSGLLDCDLYLLGSGVDEAKLLGSWEGDYSDLEGFAAASASLLLPRLSGGSRWIADLAVQAPDASYRLATALPKEASAVLAGSRLFIYRPGEYEVEVKAGGSLGTTVKISTPLHDVYNKIPIQLEKNPSVPAESATEAIRAAATGLQWPNRDPFSKNLRGFSSALGRLVVSLPVSAIALGVFYLGYEGYSRSAVTETELWIRGGIAGVGLAATAAFVVDTGVWLARLMSSAH